MNSKDAAINRLIFENAKLRAKAAEPCRTCKHLRRHDCWTLYECPYLGVVDPNGPGCQKHKGGTHGKKQTGEDA